MLAGINDMLRKANQAMTAAYMKQEPPVTLAQLAVLRAVNDGPKNQTELVHAVGSDRSTMAALVAAMATDGLVMRQRCEGDARAILVTMTYEGQKALNAARRAIRAAELDRTWGITARDGEIVRKALEIIAQPAAAMPAKRGRPKLRLRPR